MIICIDGPAGSGKSTVARAVAERLQLPYLDTGAMYRAVTFAVLRRGMDPAEAGEVAALAKNIDLDVSEGCVTVEGVDATIEIRGPEVTRAVSIVAANPAVRTEMVKRQRVWVAEHGGGVAEGRDLGTVVFPDADVKVFLTADAEVRAGRRAGEVRDLSYEAVAADLARRDALDEGRKDSPTAQAADAVSIDTTHLDIDGVVDAVVKLLP